MSIFALTQKFVNRTLCMQQKIRIFKKIFKCTLSMRKTVQTTHVQIIYFCTWSACLTNTRHVQVRH